MREGNTHLEIVKDETGSSSNRSECAKDIGRVSLHSLPMEWLEDPTDITMFAPNSSN